MHCGISRCASPFLRATESLVTIISPKRVVVLCNTEFRDRRTDRISMRRLTEFCGISDINPCQLKVKARSSRLSTQRH